jgi:hypothetical protein
VQNVPTYKTTLIFSSETGQGWTESWYQTGQSSLSAAGAQAEILMGWRSQLVGNGSSVDNWTCIDVATPRLSLSRDRILPQIDSYPSTTDNPVSSQLGLVTCIPNSGRRQFWCRGIPDSWVVFNTVTGKYDLIGVFKTAFDNFAGFITNGNWALKVVTKTVVSALKSEVLSLNPQAVTGFAELHLDPAGTLPAKVPIVVGGFRYPLQRLNGTYLYPAGYGRVGNVLTFTTRFISAFESSGYIAGAYVRQQQLTYQPITACGFDRPGDRKVGKRIGLPVGRRSAK